MIVRGLWNLSGWWYSTLDYWITTFLLSDNHPSRRYCCSAFARLWSSPNLRWRKMPLVPKAAKQRGEQRPAECVGIRGWTLEKVPAGSTNGNWLVFSVVSLPSYKWGALEDLLIRVSNQLVGWSFTYPIPARNLSDGAMLSLCQDDTPMAILNNGEPQIFGTKGFWGSQFRPYHTHLIYIYGSWQQKSNWLRTYWSSIGSYWS